MPKSSQNVSGLPLNSDKPTIFTFKQLFDWVIWQIPTPVGSAFGGAARPSNSDSKWYPALIHVKEKKVHIYAHIDERFDTPEGASNYICKNS